jgi:apolipoprotein N-acyltransferase
MAEQGLAALSHQVDVVMPDTSPGATPAPRGRAARPRLSWLVWLCPLASAALLYLAFFPVAWGWLGWVALVPGLVLVRQPGRPRFLYLACLAGGIAFHWPVLQWVRVADVMMYVAWIVVATYGALYWPVALGLVRWFERRTSLPLVVTLPTVWVALELVRYGLAGCFVSMLTGSRQHDVPGGFGWYLIGHTQHDFLQAIQIADLGGAYAVTFLVVAVNALLFEVLATGGWFRRVFLGGALPRWSSRGVLVQGASVAALLLATLGYGHWRLSQPLTTRRGPRIVLMQTNVDQRFRNDLVNHDDNKRGDAERTMWQHFVRLSGQAGRLHADLVVTPETTVPGAWVEHAPGKPDAMSQALARRLTAEMRAPLLVGMTSEVLGVDVKERAYNSAILLGRDGRWLGRYDKMHRVPFGEYIPLKRWLPFLEMLSPYEGHSWEVQPGEEHTRFHLHGRADDFTFGVLICYEDTDPLLGRAYGGGGQQPADFILNTSNDGWFDGTSEHDQHLAICRFRAVETRRSVARAVNMGISAVIDSNGRVLAPRKLSEEVWEVPEGAGGLALSDWHEYKKVGGLLAATVPLDDRVSVYARYGDWFATSCLASVLLLGVGLTLTRRSKPA